MHPKIFSVLIFTGMTAIILSCNSKIKATTQFSAEEKENTLVEILWEDVDFKSIKIKNSIIPLPKVFRTLKLNSVLMKEKLSKIISANGDKQEVVELPLPEGEFAKYKINETQTMDAALLEKFPQLRTYSGQGMDEPTSTAKLDFMPTGFHGYLFTLKGSVIINPLNAGDSLYYICYYKHDSSELKQEFEINPDSIK